MSHLQTPTQILQLSSPQLLITVTIQTAKGKNIDTMQQYFLCFAIILFLSSAFKTQLFRLQMITTMTSTAITATLSMQSSIARIHMYGDTVFFHYICMCYRLTCWLLDYYMSFKLGFIIWMYRCFVFLLGRCHCCYCCMFVLHCNDFIAHR